MLSAAWKCLGLCPNSLLIYNVKTPVGTKPCRWEHCELATLRTRTEVSYDHAKCTAENRKGMSGYQGKYFRVIRFRS
jgi:hypothetical protein